MRRRSPCLVCRNTSESSRTLICPPWPTLIDSRPSSTTSTKPWPLSTTPPENRPGSQERALHQRLLARYGHPSLAMRKPRARSLSG